VTLARGCAAALVAVACVIASRAQGDAANADVDGGADGAARARIVEVVIVGRPDDAMALHASLHELLARLGFDARTTRLDRPSGSAGAPLAEDVAARVSVDVRGDDVAHVEIVARGASVKRDVVREGSRSVLLEDVAHVVQATTESILVTPKHERDAGASLQDARIEDAPAEAAPVREPAPAPPPARSAEDAAAPSSLATGATVAIAAFASLTPYTRDSIVVGAGAGARVGLPEVWRPAFWITGAYHAPFGNSGAPVDLRASVWSVRAIPSVGVLESGRFFVDVGAGGGVDVLVLSGSTAAGATAPGAPLDMDRTDVSPVLTALVTARYALTSTAVAFAALAVDWDLRPRRYVVADGDARTALVAPLAVRPGLALGLSFDLIGAGGAR
jgi:hypothetical protein